MKPILIYIFICCAVATFCGCAKDERLIYQQDARIYFRANIPERDSINYSFGIKSETLMTDTVYLTLRIMGVAEPRDREIKLSLSDSSTAKWGYHFSTGPLVMPAGQYETRIPVCLYRRLGMKDSIITAEFIIEESKDFRPGYSDKPDPGLKRDRLHYKVSVDDQVLKPANWASTLEVKFGAFSVTKFRFMVAVTGRTNWTSLIYPSEMNFLVQQVNLALYEYEQQYGPMLDENGIRVDFP